MKNNKIRLLAVFVIGIFSAFIIKGALEMIFFNREVIRKDCDIDKAYCFYAVRDTTPFSSTFQFLVTRHQVTGMADYGHYVDYPFSYAPGDKAEIDQIKKATIQFSDEGLLYTHPTKHTLFIPCSSYIGGR